jgi:hypothetical protein
VCLPYQLKRIPQPFACDGRLCEGRGACTPHPQQAGLEFTMMMESLECTPESGYCQSIFTLPSMVLTIQQTREQVQERQIPYSMSYSLQRTQK